MSENDKIKAIIKDLKSQIKYHNTLYQKSGDLNNHAFSIAFSDSVKICKKYLKEIEDE